MAAKLPTVLGIAAVMIGIALPYLGLTYESFWFVIAAGIALSLIGAIACAWRASRRANFVAGAVCLAAAVGSFLLAGSNPHIFGCSSSSRLRPSSSR